MDTDSSALEAATLREVVFAYDRDFDLPPAASFAGDAAYDPDERGGAVLRGLDLDITTGTFTAVMGASGGGKSTLLRTFNAIIPNFITGSFSGSVDVLGRDATTARVPEMAQDVGMVLQDYEAQLFGTSVGSETAFGPENLGVDPTDISPRIDHALSVVGLESLDHRRPPEALSGGQKQRLVFAGVVANHPRLLLLDEPTSDLDPVGSHETLSVIRSLADAESAPASAAADTLRAAPEGWAGPETIVMVTHETEEALLADHAVLLRAGRVYRHGPARAVFTDVEALTNARVAVPPVVDIFDQLGWERDRLTLYPGEAVDAVIDAGLTWEPPARADTDFLPGAPAGTGRTTGDPLFELTDLVHAYETDRETVRAVDGVSLTIAEGEVVAIVGHNGSGKTTLAKHLNGLLEPDAGRAHWRGKPLADRSMSEIGRSVGYVFQNPDHQIFADTVREEVAFGPKNFGLDGEALETAVVEALETVDLDGLEDADPFTLSKGQRQRVALASILATDPDAIVFDEPTTGLDASQREGFMNLVARLNRETGVTVVMVTHSMHTVARYAPRTVVMADGQISFDGPTRTLFADVDRLERWSLHPPQPVALSNALARETGQSDALPALSVGEVVAGLGGTPKSTPQSASPASHTDGGTEAESEFGGDRS